MKKPYTLRVTSTDGVKTYVRRDSSGVWYFKGDETCIPETCIPETCIPMSGLLGQETLETRAILEAVPSGYEAAQVLDSALESCTEVYTVEVLK